MPMTRASALLIAVVSFAAAAQTEPLPPPPLVSSEPPPAATSCTSNAECARGDVCTGFQDLGEGKWSRGTCQPSAARRYQQQPNDNAPATECTTTNDCAPGFVCGDFRDLGNGKWSRGICLVGADSRSDVPQQGPPRAGRGQRFEYLGTVPPGFRLVSERRDDLLRAGAITFGVSYAVMVVVSVVSQIYAGLIPIIGPIFHMAQTSNLGVNGLTIVFGTVHVVAQGVGLGLIIAGLVAKRQWLERDPTGPQLMLLPSAAGSPLGASLVGRF